MGIRITRELVKYVYLNTPEKETVKKELVNLYEIIEGNIKEISNDRDLKLAMKDFEMISDIFDVLYMRSDFAAGEIIELAKRSEDLKERLSRKREYVRKKKNYNGVYIYA